MDTMSLGLQAKVGSALVHLEGFLGPTGHRFDTAAFHGILADPEVQEWLAGLRKMGPLAGEAVMGVVSYLPTSTTNEMHRLLRDFEDVVRFNEATRHYSSDRMKSDRIVAAARQAVIGYFCRHAKNVPVDDRHS